YRCSPNVGYVKAVGAGEIVLVGLVVAGIALAQGRPLGLAWWKLAGMGLCVAGAVLVALEGKEPTPVPQPGVTRTTQAAPPTDLAGGAVMSPSVARRESPRRGSSRDGQMEMRPVRPCRRATHRWHLEPERGERSTSPQGAPS